LASCTSESRICFLQANDPVSSKGGLFYRIPAHWLAGDNSNTHPQAHPHHTKHQPSKLQHALHKTL
jgi:hypothetical protein